MPIKIPINSATTINAKIAITFQRSFLAFGSEPSWTTALGAVIGAERGDDGGIASTIESEGFASAAETPIPAFVGFIPSERELTIGCDVGDSVTLPRPSLVSF